MNEDAVEIEWEAVQVDDQTLLTFRGVLYAYLKYPDRKIIYIGKADHCSVKERMRGPHKDRVFAKLLEPPHMVDKYMIIVGTMCLPRGRNFSSELLGDVESLLIYALQPVGNR